MIYPYFKSNFVQDAPTIYYIVLYSYVPVFFTLNKVHLSEVTRLTYYFLRILKMKRKRGEKVFLSRESSVDKQRDMTISGK